MRPRHVLISLFDEYLDEALPKIKILDYEYLASEVLRDVDPIAYREELLNWASQVYLTQEERDQL